MSKKKRRYLPKPTKNSGFDRFNELKPLVNKMNTMAVGSKDADKEIRMVGEGLCYYNYIRYGNGWILVNLTTVEDSMDPKSHYCMRKMKDISKP